MKAIIESSKKEIAILKTQTESIELSRMINEKERLVDQLDSLQSQLRETNKIIQDREQQVLYNFLTFSYHFD